MLDKKSYLETKRQIKCLCKTDIIELANNMQLSDYEKDLLMYFIDNKSKVQMCNDLNISSTKCTLDMKMLFTKIYNYKNTH